MKEKVSVIFERIQSPTHHLFEKAFDLYQKSFPSFEQRLRKNQIDVLWDEKYYFNIILCKGTFVGIVLFWEHEDFIYIEHIAICPEKRGQNLGTEVLEILKMRGKYIILEIDPPEDEVSKRRKDFYEKVGFILSDVVHSQLPYQLKFEPTPLKIMSYPAISHGDYYSFKDYLENHIMRYTEQFDNP